jgi:hypothetical protein
LANARGCFCALFTVLANARTYFSVHFAVMANARTYFSVHFTVLAFAIGMSKGVLSLLEKRSKDFIAML